MNALDTNNEWSLESLENEISKLEKIRYNLLINGEFPYLDIFMLTTNSGEEVEKMLQAKVFTDILRVKGESHDYTSNKVGRLEAKLIRMMLSGDGDYVKRAISITDIKRGFMPNKKKYGGKTSTKTFQQVKPQEFDYLIGVVLYKDGMDIFILPSNFISQNVKKRELNKAYLSSQHKGNKNEGQINYNDEVLNQNYCFSVYNDGKKCYYFDKLKKNIGVEFHKIELKKLIDEKFGF